VETSVRKQATYESKKSNLVGEQVLKGTGPQKIIWTVHTDVTQEEAGPEQSFLHGSPGNRTRASHAHCQVGVNERSGRRRNNVEEGEEKEPQRISFYKLLLQLWPGNWRRHLQNMNTAINESNQCVENAVEEGQYTNRNRPTAVNAVSAKEFWTFWGLMIYSCVVDAKGNLWQTSEEHDGLQSPKYNMTSYMAKHRFEKIKRFIPMMAADITRKSSDP
jgi:hypothetical protein